MHFTFSFSFQKPTWLIDPLRNLWINDGLLLEGRRKEIKDQWRHLEWNESPKWHPPGFTSRCYWRQNLKKLALYFISERNENWESQVADLAAGDTALQQTQSLELQRKLLCSPAQVTSCSALVDTVSHISSFHHNFKKVNVILGKIYKDAKF